MAIESTLKQAYEFATEDDEDKVCDNLPDEACQEVPGNLFLNVVDRMATKLADQLANPGLVLPWFLDSVGAPAAVIGFLTRFGGLALCCLNWRAPARSAASRFASGSGWQASAKT